ncbi:MAG: radical SAM protein [Solirubrobacteraceae bacterium]
MAVDSLTYENASGLAPTIEGLEFLWLELTQNCNLRCAHCYTNSSPECRHPRIDWQPLIDEAHVLGCHNVQFIGGEPMAHPRLQEYVRHARHVGYEFIEVYTNLTISKPRIIEVFAECGVNVATSFYSADRSEHERVTGVRGSFDRTVTGIRRVIEAGLPLRVGMVAENPEREEVRAAVDFLVKLGVAADVIRIDHVRPVGRGSDIAPFESLEETLCGHCWERRLAVSFDGSCYPCVFSRSVIVGNIGDQTLTQVVQSPTLRSFRKSMARGPSLQCTPDCNPAGPCNPNCTPKCAPPCDPNCNPKVGCPPYRN